MLQYFLQCSLGCPLILMLFLWFNSDFEDEGEILHYVGRMLRFGVLKRVVHSDHRTL
jgi:hypothetical protein